MSAAEKAKGRVLLPNLVQPTRYEVKLTPDLDQYVFDGQQSVEVEVQEATAEVTMNSRELRFGAVSFTADSDPDKVIEAAAINTNIKDMTVTFVFEEILPVGKGKINIEFTGILNNQMAGFYRSNYKDFNGNTKVMASTQFEAIDARRCFPCWDEPAQKAVFAVTLVVDPTLTAMSNMPERCSKLIKVGSKTLKEISFMDSPKMSTYLLAIVIGEFDYIQDQTKNGVLVRVYTPPNRTSDGEFALATATKCLDLYDEFFGLPYPLPKLDMVAIPEFAAGAMENWGLVTYREVDLMIDQKNASNQQKQRVCIVVTHELAHQWFGNLVTMAWWDDLWLNEGFASWCENWAADVINPQYKMWDQFPFDTLGPALRLDSLESSHPIQVPIARAETVDEVFDAISYCKGASVIRMAHAVIGHEAFRKGLQAYMKKHQYSNTETFDLWSAWSESSGTAVKDLMSTWTEQMGFPLLEVKSFKIEGSVAKLSLEQSWFLSSGKVPPEEKTWNVPLLIRTAKQTGRDAVMMTSKTMDVEVPLGAGETADEAFIMINEGIVTPMRVSYTPEMLQRLAKAVSAGKLSAIDRSGLLMDLYALAKAGKIGLDEVLKFVSSYAGEKDYVVWEALDTVLMGSNKLFMGGAPPEMHARFKAFASALVSKGWKEVDCGWTSKPTDGHTDGLLRSLLMRLVSHFAPDGDWIEEARRRFDLYVEDPEGRASDLPDEYRTTVLQAVLSKGGKEEYTKLMAAYRKLEKNVDLKHVQLSVGWSPVKSVKEEVMSWAISGEVKIQDFFYVMIGVSASSREGLGMMWEFFKSNFKTIHKMVKSANGSIMDACLSASCGGWTSEEKASEVEAFFEKNPLPANTRKISQILEEIRANAGFLSRTVASDLAKEEFWNGLA
mmetsp:Transcript_86918/g.190909  ORF Transcript_86918/g.190909 Transcript_86918/m.190909 type:complete len:893 (-) Transcript_86918:215-2893(-)